MLIVLQSICILCVFVAHTHTHARIGSAFFHVFVVVVVAVLLRCTLCVGFVECIFTLSFRSFIDSVYLSV